MSGLSKLKDLKKTASTEAAPSPGPAPVKEKAAKVVSVKSAEGTDPIAKKGFTPRTKDPAKAALETQVKEGITALLKGDAVGRTAEELRSSLFDKIEESEIKSTERMIRQLCRSMGCVANPIEGSRRVKYTLTK